MPATIYDIARVAGVSSSTVARVLRGDMKEGRKDSAERAARIRRIALQLGYRPNLRARAFSERKTRGVGLLYSDDRWVFEGVNDQVLQGLVGELRKHRHHLVLAPLDEHGHWEEVVLGGYVDGCVTFQPLPQRVRRGLADADLPCVLLGDNSDPELPHIVVDDHGGAYAATRHLISLGHQRIGLYIHSSVKPHCSLEERRNGFVAAMIDNGLTAECWHVGEAEIIDVLLRDSYRPTALICYCDLESTLIMHAMWQYGIKVPGELSIVGFNDIFATQYMTPPLTTVGFDAHQIGVLGAQMIIQSLTSDSPLESALAQSVRMPTRLLVRGSTAPPKDYEPPARVEEEPESHLAVHGEHRNGHGTG